MSDLLKDCHKTFGEIIERYGKYCVCVGLLEMCIKMQKRIEEVAEVNHE